MFAQTFNIASPMLLACAKAVNQNDGSVLVITRRVVDKRCFELLPSPGLWWVSHGQMRVMN